MLRTTATGRHLLAHGEIVTDVTRRCAAPASGSGGADDLGSSALARSGIFEPMVDVARRRISYAEYVAIANDSPVKYEYIAGEIVAMSGGTIAHGRLNGRTPDALNRALDGKRCIVLPSDLRVRIRSAERSTYPDLHIVCGAIERDPMMITRS